MRRNGWRKMFLTIANDQNTSLAFAQNVLQIEKLGKENKELKQSLDNEKLKSDHWFVESKRLQTLLMKVMETNNNNNNKKSIKINKVKNIARNRINSPTSSAVHKYVNPKYAHIQSKVAAAWKVTRN